MTHAIRASGALVVFLVVAACTPEQRDTVDSAAGAAETLGRTALSVLNLETGRRAGPDRKITDETETFAPTDTIFASVHMSGTVNTGDVKGQWSFPDGSVVDQPADSANADNRLLFFLTKPEGLAKGKYTFRVIVNGKQVREEGLTVQ